MHLISQCVSVIVFESLIYVSRPILGNVVNQIFVHGTWNIFNLSTKVHPNIENYTVKYSWQNKYKARTNIKKDIAKFQKTQN